MVFRQILVTNWLKRARKWFKKEKNARNPKSCSKVAEQLRDSPSRLSLRLTSKKSNSDRLIYQEYCNNYGLRALIRALLWGTSNRKLFSFYFIRCRYLCFSFHVRRSKWLSRPQEREITISLKSINKRNPFCREFRLLWNCCTANSSSCQSTNAEWEKLDLSIQQKPACENLLV